MTCYRPTTLKLASQHCPRALDYYEQGAPTFREHFAVGIAAHDCLAEVGELALRLGRAPESGEILTTCEAVVRRLITQGRRFEGQPEPPMPAEDAYEGRDLAVTYALLESTAWPTMDASYERGLAFDESWRPVAYDDRSRRFRLILDTALVSNEEGEEYAARVAVARDYKTAWTTDERELQTYQLRAQAVALWLTVHDIDAIWREVVNLRTSQTFREDLWLESGGREQLAAWTRELTAYMRALDDMRDGQGRRPARPGAGCLSCPWAMTCDARPAGDSADEMAARLARIEGEREKLTEALKQAVKNRGAAIRIGASAVGWQKKIKTAPAEYAAASMWLAWQERGGDLAGFLAALAPGVSSMRAVAKALHRDDEDAQDALVQQWTERKHGREFGVYRIEDGIQQ